MNKPKLEQAARLIIEAIGENPKREGLLETPKRFAKMIAEQLEYANISNKAIAKKFNKCFTCDSDNMVIEKDINTFSYCEHHIALMYDLHIAVGYIPNGKVIGLSKIARIADAVCKRLQLQEKIGKDILEIMQTILDTKDVIVFIEGKHSCMTARGIKQPNSVTRTVTCGGNFYKPQLKDEFMTAVK